MQTKIPKIIEGDFYEVINDALKKGRHVDYLKKALKEYEEYKKVFEKIFTGTNVSNSLYLFRADYLLKQPVWRDILILGNQTLKDLAEAIIFSMDWENDHMHGFGFPNKPGKTKFNFFESPYAIYAPGWEDDPYPTYKSDQVRIDQINFTIYPKLQFVFDFGDGHLFNVTLKKTIPAAKTDNEELLPQIVDQRGIAPEQYPDLDEDNFRDEDMESRDWFHEDCKSCQELKNQGIEMQWYPDHSLPKKKVVN